ncbi:ribonuclease Z [Saccharopolyspora hirsuta]|uniref:Ribonuclease Z n=1 Tax=Saccharopolyspora hirsuta TaxID=1837 RepID=A0A5M7C236_SACHI|nr:ribonuclease Z [Saccharopolyspora hirsuta]KAA5834537.1 ribonuclease Z [Saccharopolyspora hirsuta]
MSNRELVVLGTASQAPTRARNHNGYLLRWDGVGFLFDPGEGTQRQMIRAGVSSHDIDHICISHFHGDHCLGLPGVLQRLSLDRMPRPVHAHFPAAGTEFFRRLHRASAFDEVAEVRERPVERGGTVFTGAFGALEAVPLDHRIETFGYRLVEPDGRRMLPDRLARFGVRGPDVGRLQRAGSLRVGARTVSLEEVSEPRPGQRFAFVMDTRLCDGVFELAAGADVLVIESTFLEQDARLADEYRHLTAAQAARVAAECGVRCLVLTHFSQRYPDPRRFRDEAAEVFDGQLVVAEDLVRVPVPPRR